jgi:hypothetical protein
MVFLGLSEESGVGIFELFMACTPLEANFYFRSNN